MGATVLGLAGHLEEAARLCVLLAHDAVEGRALRLVVDGDILIHGPQLDRVDAEVAAAREDGVHVLVGRARRAGAAGLEVVVQPEAEEARLKVATEGEAVRQLLHALIGAGLGPVVRVRVRVRASVRADLVEIDEVGVLAARAVDGGLRLQREHEAGVLAWSGPGIRVRVRVGW